MDIQNPTISSPVEKRLIWGNQSHRLSFQTLDGWRVTTTGPPTCTVRRSFDFAGAAPIGEKSTTIDARNQIAENGKSPAAEVDGRILHMATRHSFLTGSVSRRENQDNGDSSDLKRSFLPDIVTKLVMNKKNLKEYPRQTRQAGSMRIHGWKLGEAKAKFSRVVRLAASGQPQRVTVRGKDAVVIVAAAEFERLRARAASDSLHELLSQSPLNRLELDDEGVRSPVREVEL